MPVLEPFLLFAKLYCGQDLLIDDLLLKSFSKDSNVPFHRTSELRFVSPI